MTEITAQPVTLTGPHPQSADGLRDEHYTKVEAAIRAQWMDLREYEERHLREYEERHLPELRTGQITQVEGFRFIETGYVAPPKKTKPQPSALLTALMGRLDD